jgi:hypothetical protein
VVSRAGLANLAGGGLRHGTSELDEPRYREVGQPLAQRRPVRPAVAVGTGRDDEDGEPTS